MKKSVRITRSTQPKNVSRSFWSTHLRLRLIPELLLPLCKQLGNDIHL